MKLNVITCLSGQFQRYQFQKFSVIFMNLDTFTYNAGCLWPLMLALPHFTSTKRVYTPITKTFVCVYKITL